MVVIFVTAILGLLISQGNCHESKYKLKISDDDKIVIFQYLDKDGDEKLNKDEVARLFNHHEDASAISAKFIALIDGHDAGNDINQQELSNFIEQKTVTFALYDCSFELSKSLKRQCYEDRIISFVHLVLPNHVAHEFFAEFSHDEDGNIGLEQVKEFVSEEDENKKASDADNFLRELGKHDGVISEVEFVSYVKQEDLHDHFRECFGKEKKYNYPCLKTNLLKYTADSFTEMDIELLFDLDNFETSTGYTKSTSLDGDHDDFIESADLMGSNGCNAPCDPEKFLTIMDTEDKDSLVNFAEFRNFIKKPTVRIRVQKRCSERYVNQAAELECYRKELFNVVGEHHKPIWLSIPKTDMLLLFEKMDVDNDGKIEILDDLQKLGYSEEIAKKTVSEMDGNDKGKTINLQEFNDYFGVPSVVYTLGDCRKHKRGDTRTDCYKNQLQLYMTDILDKGTVRTFFRFYDHTKNGLITEEDLHFIFKKSDDIDEFLDELGMGDDSVNFAEFSWYVRQREVLAMFKDNECDNEPENLHKILMKYIGSRMTEMNLQCLFDQLDTDDSWDLEPSDWNKVAEENGKTTDDVDELLRKMDLPPDHDKVVNFEEFRLFMVLNNRKEHLEKKNVSAKNVFLQTLPKKKTKTVMQKKYGTSRNS